MIWAFHTLIGHSNFTLRGVVRSGHLLILKPGWMGFKAYIFPKLLLANNNTVPDEWWATIFSHSVWGFRCCWGFLFCWVSRVSATNIEVLYLRYGTGQHPQPGGRQRSVFCWLSGEAFEVYGSHSGLALISCALESYPGTSLPVPVCWNTSTMFSPRSFKLSNFKFGLWVNFDWLLYKVRNLGPVSVFDLRMSSVPQHHFLCVCVTFRWDPIHWTCEPRSVWDRILSCSSRCPYVHAMLSYWLCLCKMSWNQVLWGLQQLAGFYSRLLWLFAMVSASIWILGSVLTLLWEWHWLYQSLSIYTMQLNNVNYVNPSFFF